MLTACFLGVNFAQKKFWFVAPPWPPDLLRPLHSGEKNPGDHWPQALQHQLMVEEPGEFCWGGADPPDSWKVVSLIPGCSCQALWDALWARSVSGEPVVTRCWLTPRCETWNICRKGRGPGGSWRAVEFHHGLHQHGFIIRHISVAVRSCISASTTSKVPLVFRLLRCWFGRHRCEGFLLQIQMLYKWTYVHHTANHQTSITRNIMNQEI